MNAQSFEAQVGPIHPKDDMFTGSHEAYFNAGMSAMAAIERGLALGGREWGDIGSCLDLPSGYGRVLRHLVTRIPAQRVTACDLMTDAVDFCVRQFGVRGVQSREDLSSVVLGTPFDLIWVGSLFTHLPLKRSIELLRLLRRSLSDRGVLVMSVVGDDCLDRVLASQGYAGRLLGNKAHQDASRLAAEYVNSGFTYVPYANAESYGLAFLSIGGVCQLVEAATESRMALLGYERAGWNHDHDVYVLAHRPESPVGRLRAAAGAVAEVSPV